MSPMCDVCLMLPIEVSRPPAGQRNMLTLCLTDQNGGYGQWVVGRVIDKPPFVLACRSDAESPENTQDWQAMGNEADDFLGSLGVGGMNAAPKLHVSCWSAAPTPAPVPLTSAPTATPTPAPTASPTASPTAAPTPQLTMRPYHQTVSPTPAPTAM